MEKVKNEVKKAVLRKDRLTVVYTEHLPEANYTNTINKSCDQIVHSDLKEAMSKLRHTLSFYANNPKPYASLPKASKARALPKHSRITLSPAFRTTLLMASPE